MVEDVPSVATRVLVLDGDRGPLHAATKLLIELGYHPLACRSPWRALEILGRWEIAAILLDLHVANLGGLGFLDGIRLVSAPARPAVICTSAVYVPDEELQATLQERGAVSFLSKPIERKALERALAHALDGATPEPRVSEGAERRNGWRWELDWDGYVLTEDSMVRCNLVEGGDRGLRLEGPSASLIPPGERVVVRAGPRGRGIAEITLQGVVAWTADGPSPRAGVFLSQASPRRQWLASAQGPR